MSITDDIMSKAPDHVAKASDMTMKAVNVARGGIKDAAGIRSASGGSELANFQKNSKASERR